MEARSSTLLWIGLALGIALAIVVPIAGLALIAIVAVVAQVRGDLRVRTCAVVVLVAALLLVLFGPWGGSVDGGLID